MSDTVSQHMISYPCTFNVEHFNEFGGLHIALVFIFSIKKLGDLRPKSLGIGIVRVFVGHFR